MSIGNPEAKRALRRPSPRWKDNINIDITEREREDRKRWTGLVCSE
jgi:hypothetical protein